MKKNISIFVAAILLASNMFGCGSYKTTQVEQQNTNGKLKIVVTIFPIYDYVKNILGEKFDKDNVSILLDNSVDLHNYQPTSADIVKISNCDLFIYVGGESDAWVDDVLNQVNNSNLAAISLMQLLDSNLRLEEEKEGMEEEHEHEEGVEHEEEEEYDEHVWLSLKNTEKVISLLTKALKMLDDNNAKLYEENANAYIKQIKNLDKEYTDLSTSAKNKMLIFGDRFPFLYMVKDYGLDYFAAFKGCSAETEASFKTIAFLAQKLDEYNLDYVMTIEGTNHKIAETIIENSNDKNRKILSLNSMQSITAKDIEEGKNYIDIMKSNLEILKQALN